MGLRAVRPCRRRPGAELAQLRRDGFAVLPRDVNFHAGLTMLAHAADELGDAELAAELEPLLRPLADYWVVLGVGSATLGPVAYSLGVCNLLTGRLDAAVADFELAIAKCRADARAAVRGTCLAAAGTGARAARRARRRRARRRAGARPRSRSPRSWTFPGSCATLARSRKVAAGRAGTFCGA